MKLLTVLKEAMQEYSEKPIPKEEIPAIIETILDNSFEDAIKKTRIPKPPGPIEIIIEELQYQRRSKHYRKIHRPIDYSLWYALYHAKLELTNTFETSLRHEFLDNGLTTSFEMLQTKQDNISSHIHDVVLSDSSKIDTSDEISYFDIGLDLENRILRDSTVASFVSCVEETCRTRNTELSHKMKFAINERKDTEIQNWIKIILDIKFKDQSLEASILEWEHLRKLIDTALDQLNQRQGLDQETFKKLRKDFYIKLLP